MTHLVARFRRFVIATRHLNINAYAASAAFFLFVSLVPILVLICSIFPYTGLSETELIELIEALKRQKCENQHIEVKKALGGTSKKLSDTLSSFSNQNDGGTILFGIDEKAGYAVTGVYDAQDLQVQVKNAAEQMEPVVRPFFTVAEYQGKVVVSAEIPECEPICR